MPQFSPASIAVARFPDPAYERSFRAYSNYFEDLAALMYASYAWRGESLVEAVHDKTGVLSAVTRLQRRRLGQRDGQALDFHLRKAWSFLRRLYHELEEELFDEEANGWLPEQAYYAVHSAIIATAIASQQSVPQDHRAALSLAGDHAEDGRLPFPWSATCSGCPQTGTHRFRGLPNTQQVHVLSRPAPDTATDRLAMLLRTTRQKELERRFAKQRGPRSDGSRKRNICRAEKERIGSRTPATTIFDVLYRVRRKAHYEEPDLFILGASGEVDARRFAQGLVLVTDASVAALEALVAAYVGPAVVSDVASRYAARTQSPLVQMRASAWRGRLSGRDLSGAARSDGNILAR